MDVLLKCSVTYSELPCGSTNSSVSKMEALEDQRAYRMETLPGVYAEARTELRRPCNLGRLWVPNDGRDATQCRPQQILYITLLQ